MMRIWGCHLELATSEFHHLKEILSLANILTEHKYMKLILKVHSPNEPAEFINELAEVFLSYIPVHTQSSKLNKT